MILVDNAPIKHGGKMWYHLMSDESDNELHLFAARIGLSRDWFQGDHYDVTESKRRLAIHHGARQVTAIELVQLRKARRRNSA